MNNKKQSSIDWLVDEINLHLNFDQRLYLKELLEQAKAMHKDEMIEIGSKCFVDGHKGTIPCPKQNDDILLAEYWYNEIFGGQDNE